MKRIKHTLLSIMLTTGISGAVCAATPPQTLAPPQTTQQLTTATINVNTATIEQLSTLKGIGPAKAKAIVQFREEYGTFKSLDDLASVKGIGSKTIEKNRLLATAQ